MLTKEQRHNTHYRIELAKFETDNIAGTARKQKAYFDQVIAGNPDCLWIEGWNPSACEYQVIGLRCAESATSIREEAIPFFPFNNLLAEFHIKQFIADNKWKKQTSTEMEPLPEWATTPILIVDKNVNDLSERIMCGRKPINAQNKTFAAIVRHDCRKESSYGG